MSHFRLRFPLDEIPRWAEAYTYPLGDTEPVEIGAAAKGQGYLTRPQFLALARWKSARPAKHHEKNDAATVEAVTRFAFTTPVELLRLSALTLLKGVQPPAEAKTDLRTLDRALWGFSAHSGKVAMPASKRGSDVEKDSP